MPSNLQPRIPTWSDTYLARIVSAMNREPALEYEGMEIIALDSLDVHVVWLAWSQSVSAIRRGDAKPLRSVLGAVRELGLGDRAIRLMPNDDGHLVQANTSPRGEFIADVVQLIDMSAQHADPLTLLDRLRRCPRTDCESFFDDPHRRARYCSDDCVAAGRRELVRKRVRRHRGTETEQPVSSAASRPSGARTPTRAPAGVPLDGDRVVEKQWRPVLRVTDIRPRKLYAARHTFISAALTRGVNLKWLADYCGTSVQMIERNYGRWMAGDDDQLALLRPAAHGAVALG